MFNLKGNIYTTPLPTRLRDKFEVQRMVDDYKKTHYLQAIVRQLHIQVYYGCDSKHEPYTS